MTCPNCGAQISDDARFCGKCGSPVTSAADANANGFNSQQQSAASTNDFSGQQQSAIHANNFNNQQQPFQDGTDSFQSHPGQFQKGYNPNSSENIIQKILNFIKTHIPLMVGAAAACLILLGVVLVLAVSVLSHSYKKPIDAALRYRNNQSTDLKEYFYEFNGNALTGQLYYDTIKLFSDLKLEDYEDYEESLEDNLTEQLEDYYDEISDIYGDDWEITYNIKRVKEIRESKLEDYEDELEELADSLEDRIDNLDDYEDLSNDDIKKMTKFLEKWSDKFSDAEITKGYRVTVRLTLKGDEDRKSKTGEINVIKAGGTWLADKSLSDLLSDLTEQDLDYFDLNLKSFF